FTRLAESRPEQPPAQADFDALVAQTRSEGPPPETGAVTVIGAGTGDPQLLTIRAVRALQSADVIVMDAAVPPAALGFRRSEAKKIFVDDGDDRSGGHDAIALMISLAQSGQRVVRFRGGDPSQGTEAAITACRQAGVAIDIVPAVATKPDGE